LKESVIKRRLAPNFASCAKPSSIIVLLPLSSPLPMTPEQFIARRQPADGTELANAQSFVREFTELLELPSPNPAREDTRDNDYVF
jgi:hypothetical protein